MSRENIELVRRVMAEFNETQQPSEFLAPDFVWDMRSWPVWTGQPEFHGAGSDSWVDLRATFLYTIEDGLITRIKVYESAGQAFKDAAVSE